MNWLGEFAPVFVGDATMKMEDVQLYWGPPNGYAQADVVNALQSTGACVHVPLTAQAAYEPACNPTDSLSSGDPTACITPTGRVAPPFIPGTPARFPANHSWTPLATSWGTAWAAADLGTGPSLTAAAPGISVWENAWTFDSGQAITVTGAPGGNAWTLAFYARFDGAAGTGLYQSVNHGNLKGGDKAFSAPSWSETLIEFANPDCSAYVSLRVLPGLEAQLACLSAETTTEISVSTTGVNAAQVFQGNTINSASAGWAMHSIVATKQFDMGTAAGNQAGLFTGTFLEGQEPKPRYLCTLRATCTTYNDYFWYRLKTSLVTGRRAV